MTHAKLALASTAMLALASPVIAEEEITIDTIADEAFEVMVARTQQGCDAKHLDADCVAVGLRRVSSAISKKAWAYEHSGTSGTTSQAPQVNAPLPTGGYGVAVTGEGVANSTERPQMSSTGEGHIASGAVSGEGVQDGGDTTASTENKPLMPNAQVFEPKP